LPEYFFPFKLTHTLTQASIIKSFQNTKNYPFFGIWSLVNRSGRHGGPVTAVFLFISCTPTLLDIYMNVYLFPSLFLIKATVLCRTLYNKTAPIRFEHDFRLRRFCKYSVLKIRHQFKTRNQFKTDQDLLFSLIELSIFSSIRPYLTSNIIYIFVTNAQVTERGNYGTPDGGCREFSPTRPLSDVNTQKAKLYNNFRYKKIGSSGVSEPFLPSVLVPCDCLAVTGNRANISEYTVRFMSSFFITTYRE